MSAEIIQSILTNLSDWNPYIHNSAKTTNSIYIKFCHPRCGSLRLSNHQPKKKYLFRWQIRTDLTKVKLFSRKSNYKQSTYSHDNLSMFYQEFISHCKAENISPHETEEPVIIFCPILHQTTKAILIREPIPSLGLPATWLSKSIITIPVKETKTHYKISIPKWLYESKALQEFNPEEQDVRNSND